MKRITYGNIRDANKGGSLYVGVARALICLCNYTPRLKKLAKYLTSRQLLLFIFHNG